MINAIGDAERRRKSSQSYRRKQRRKQKRVPRALFDQLEENSLGPGATCRNWFPVAGTSWRETTANACPSFGMPFRRSFNNASGNKRWAGRGEHLHSPRARDTRVKFLRACCTSARTTRPAIARDFSTPRLPVSASLSVSPFNRSSESRSVTEELTSRGTLWGIQFSDPYGFIIEFVVDIVESRQRWSLYMYIFCRQSK